MFANISATSRSRPAAALTWSKSGISVSRETPVVSHPDDERLGQLLRAARRRSDFTQEQLSILTGIPVKQLRRIEAGNAGGVEFDRIRSAFRGVGGRVRVTAWWNGAAADRLVDESHAAIVESAAKVFRARGWLTRPEVSFSEYGERGSVDLFAANELNRAVATCEIKSEFGSLEEMNRSFDVKVRLTPKICQRLYGWKPSVVGRILVVPNVTTIRRVIARHSATMDALYPARSREVRAWLRSPTTNVGAIWFVSIRS